MQCIKVLQKIRRNGISTFRPATLRPATVNPGQLIPRHFIPPTNNLATVFTLFYQDIFIKTSRTANLFILFEYIFIYIPEPDSVETFSKTLTTPWTCLSQHFFSPTCNSYPAST